MDREKVRLVKDCIYGHIVIPKLCDVFMNTPEFQRLRRIKQLGITHYIYPSAVHTRFEHSLGVMHLAGKMVDHLRDFVDIPDRLKSLIQLAGLYHDIGHAAFSHLFDAFLENDDGKEETNDYFHFHKHEMRSIVLLREVNQRLQALDQTEETMVINMIQGKIENTSSTPSTPYLYQIICNRDSGVDVDKMDYLRRDAYHTGLPGFQADYIILNSVIDSSGCIAYRHKAKCDMNDLFVTRTKMHLNVYQHHTAKQIDRIYFCAMRRLGKSLFQYGKQTDDQNIETLMRNSLPDLMLQIDTRQLSHQCEMCRDYDLRVHVPQSGSIDLVRFV